MSTWLNAIDRRRNKFGVSGIYFPMTEVFKVEAKTRQLYESVIAFPCLSSFKEIIKIIKAYLTHYSSLMEIAFWTIMFLREQDFQWGKKSTMNNNTTQFALQLETNLFFLNAKSNLLIRHIWHTRHVLKYAEKQIQRII